MPNSIVVQKALGTVAKAAAKTISDNLQFVKSVDKEDASSLKGFNGTSSGDTIYIKKPARFIPTTAFDITSSIQDFNEEQVAMPINIVRSVAVSFTTEEMAYAKDVQKVIKDVAMPAAISIAHAVESTCLNRAALAVGNQVGTAGSSTFTPLLMLQAGAKLKEFDAPMDMNKYALLSSQAEINALDQRKALFNSVPDLAKQYKMGYMGSGVDGLNYMSNNLLPVITTGSATGSITVTTTVATQGQTTINLTGTGTQTLVAGQVISFAGRKAVHPITKVAYPYDKQFVITANNTAAAGAFTAVALGEGLYTTGSLQNISSFPTASDVVTINNGTTASTGYTQNLVYHSSAFRFISAPLVLPQAVEFAVQETVEGITVSIVRAYDQLKRTMVTRMDFLGGFVAVRPEWACKVI